MRLTYVISCMVCAAASVAHAQPNAQYCTALGALNSNLDRLDSLGSAASGRDVRGIADQLDTDIRQIQQQAALSNSPEASQFLASSERLLVKSRFVPDSMPIAQATSQIREDVTQVRQSAQALASQASCPGVTAGAQGQQPQQPGPQQPGAQQPQAQAPGAQQPQQPPALPAGSAQPQSDQGSNIQQPLDQMGSNIQQPLDQGSNVPQLPNQGSSAPAPTDVPQTGRSPE